MRHPNVRRTHATPFPHDSRQRRKLPTTSFLTAIILNRREIPHRLDSPCVAPMYGLTSLRRTDRSRTTNASYVQSDVPMMH